MDARQTEPDGDDMVKATLGRADPRARNTCRLYTVLAQHVTTLAVSLLSLSLARLRIGEQRSASAARNVSVWIQNP